MGVLLFRCSPNSKCDAPLPCGHACQLMGHDEDIEHQTSHQCQANCNTTLPCGHVCASLCHKEDQEHKGVYKCPINCKPLLICGSCSTTDRKYVLPCGHSCSLLCHSIFSKRTKCHLCPEQATSHSLLTDEYNLEDDYYLVRSIPTMHFYGHIPQVCTSDPAKGEDTNTPHELGAVENLVTCGKESRAELPCDHSGPAVSCYPVPEHTKCLICASNSPNSLYSHELKSSNGNLPIIQNDPKTCNILVRSTSELAEGDTKKILPGHKCRLRGKCIRQCKALLSCGHKCILECHLHKKPHSVDERCVVCSKLRMLPELANSQIELDGDRCLHQLKVYDCRNICPGMRLCGHPCGETREHMCVDHDGCKCLFKCKVKMSCGHVCTKTCHVGDSVHKCVPLYPKPCENALEATSNIPDVGKGIVKAPGHEHRLDTCQKMCKTALYCGHICNLRCSDHNNYPHLVSEKCFYCTASDALQKHLSSSGIQQFREVPSDHCSHFVEDYNCLQVCEGRLCGHPCGLSTTHLCSYHTASGPCQRKCGIELSCRHKCFKTCHIGDYAHACRGVAKNKERCINAPKLSGVLDAQDTRTDPDQRDLLNIENGSTASSKSLDGNERRNVDAEDSNYRTNQDRANGDLLDFNSDQNYQLNDLDMHRSPRAWRLQFLCSPQIKCDAPLPCGHACRLMGHDLDVEHQNRYQCQTHCDTTLPCGHVCVSLCHDVDPEHKALYKCPVKCEGLRLCGHACRIKSTVKHGCSKHSSCLEKCGYVLQCGHLCSLMCHHLVSDHMKCFLCANKPSGRLPPTNGKKPVDDDKSSTSNEVDAAAKPAESSNGCTVASIESEHTCRTSAGDKCSTKCKAPLICGHECLLPCHKEYTHNADDICTHCSKMVELRDTSKLQASQLGRTQLLNVIHCCHGAKAFKCDEICRGRPCGHSCGLPGAHKCSEHIGANEVLCSQRCETVLSCKHTCFKFCHVGDTTHKCSPFNLECANSLKITEPNSGVEEMVIYPAHKHKTGGVCLKKCKSVLSCGHQCTVQCNLHKEFPHVSSHKCRQCTLSDRLLMELMVFQIPYSQDAHFDYCSHLVKEYKCEQICEGRRCEHPCGLAQTHKCSDHAASNNIRCKIKCSLKLSCRHKCCKTCHVGDLDHKCRWMVKNDKALCYKTKDVDQVSGRHNMENASGLDRITSVKSYGEHPLQDQQEAPTACDHTCRQCHSCSKTDALRNEFPSLQIDIGLFNHCSHHIKMYECGQICKGRLCGHPCGLRKPHHTCLDHVASNKVSCREICGAELSCGWKCFRVCHLGDHVHYCKAEMDHRGTPACAEIYGDSDDVHSTSAGPSESQPNKRTSTIFLGAAGDNLEVVPAHQCRILEGYETCAKLCKAVLSCSHLCTSICHTKNNPHTMHAICGPCSKSKRLISQLSALQIKDEGQELALCRHFVSISQCGQFCKGWHCGHPCDLNGTGHFCSDHVVSCRNQCSVRLSCNHRCSKLCHLRDNEHYCQEAGCVNSFLEKHCVEDSDAPPGNCKTDECSMETPKEEDSTEKVVSSVHENHESDGACLQMCEAVSVCGHKCVLSCHLHSEPDDHKICRRGCLATLSCGHGCTLKCHIHEKFLHGPDERCQFCCLTDALRQISLLQVDKKPVLSASDLCSHLEEAHACEKICPGRLCGHPCRLRFKGHKCRDHTVLDTGICRGRCEVKMSCRHMCTKPCHIGDYDHDCSSKRVRDCANAGRGATTTQTVCGAECAETPGVIPVTISGGETLGNDPSNVYISPSIVLPATPVPFTGNAAVGALPSSGHPCRLSGSNVCRKLCKFLMKCGHRCRKRCHNNQSPHFDLEKCSFCLNSELFKKLHSPSDTVIASNYCPHSVKRELCTVRFCNKYLCGHKFKDSPLGVCREKCGVIRSCGHRCKKFCHLGDEDHVCRKGRKCKKNPKCDLVFQCGHGCLEIHEGEIPHKSLEKCDFCFASDGLWEGLFEKEDREERNCYCAHFKKRALCNEKCEGRFCGHKCLDPALDEVHVCSDHPSSNRPECSVVCRVGLPCGHKCAKECHVGDYTHDCKMARCKTRGSAFAPVVAEPSRDLITSSDEE